LDLQALSERNQNALDNLLVTIEASKGRFGIFIAVCDDPPIKDEIIRRYEQGLVPAFQHQRLVLDEKEPSLKALLVKQQIANTKLQEKRPTVVTILGAEKLNNVPLEEARSQREIFFGYLQWTREGMSNFPFAVVLWITYPLQRELIRKAPDFWSWRREVIRFE